MHFIFSSPISRLVFLARFILVNMVIALVARLLFLIVANPAQSASTLVTAVAWAGSGVVVLAAIFYLVRFVAMARLESIGMSTWYGLLALLPVGAVFLQEFLIDSGITWLDSLPWQLTCMVIYLLFVLLLLIMPQNAFRHGSVIQAILYDYEVDEGRVIIRLVPLLVALVFIGGWYNFEIYRGLSDAQSMDNAQLARQIVRGHGYTTKFLRPQAVTQLRDFRTSQNLGTGRSVELFPEDRFPKGAPRVLPDTYNAPGYPLLLAAWFYLVRPQFDQAIAPNLDGFVNVGKGGNSHVYSGDRWIPPLNLIFTLLTGLLVFVLGWRLFDDRVAWLATVAFFATDMIWQYSVTGLSTSFLTFLVTAILCCTLEIFCLSEAVFESEAHSFGLAWLWAILLGLLLAVACLTRLNLLALLVPLLILFCLMPRPSWGIAVMIGLVVVASVVPWFWHLEKVSGNPIGSNLSLVLYGEQGYKENQVFCTTALPKYDSLFKDLSEKETEGFLWHFEHGWHLLGSNPMVILFVASLMHAYKRRRSQMFQWLLIACALVIIAVNNMGVTNPDAISPWNVLAVLLPGMLVVGSAFFFIQLDRLNLQVWLLNTILVTMTLAITALPLAITLTSENILLYSFPPYMPPLIKLLGQYAQPDEWVTSDMPWASAWYSDRASLWLPDSISDFENLHDEVCPTGILFFTPVTWMKPAENILTREDKDWLPLITETTAPANFPLTVHTATPPGGPDYRIWSDRPRWQSQ